MVMVLMSACGRVLLVLLAQRVAIEVVQVKRNGSLGAANIGLEPLKSVNKCAEKVPSEWGW